MLNKCCFIGNVGRDPEIRFAQSGNKIANFSMAVTEKWNDKNSGEKKERTEWIKIVVFSEGLAGVVEKYVKKGSKLYVSGKMVTRKWTGNDRVEKYTTEVNLDNFNGELIMLDGKIDRQDSGQSQGGYPDSKTEPPKGDLDDEIPF